MRLTRVFYFMTWNFFAPEEIKGENESGEFLIKSDSMSVSRILARKIDPDLEYEAIGIVLAKNYFGAVLLTTNRYRSP